MPTVLTQEQRKFLHSEVDTLIEMLLKTYSSNTIVTLFEGIFPINKKYNPNIIGDLSSLLSDSEALKEAEDKITKIHRWYTQPETICSEAIFQQNDPSIFRLISTVLINYYERKYSNPWLLVRVKDSEFNNQILVRLYEGKEQENQNLTVEVQNLTQVVENNTKEIQQLREQVAQLQQQLQQRPSKTNELESFDVFRAKLISVIKNNIKLIDEKKDTLPCHLSQEISTLRQNIMSIKWFLSGGSVQYNQLEDCIINTLTNFASVWNSDSPNAQQVRKDLNLNELFDLLGQCQNHIIIQATLANRLQQPMPSRQAIRNFRM